MKNKSSPTSKRFVAIVLAADRTAHDPVAQHTGVVCKAFAPIGGIPMVIRVLDTLASCDLITSIILCGPPEALHVYCPELRQRIASEQIIWLPNLDSPSRSAERSLNHVPNDTPVLLTTADHALLTPDILQSFLHDSLMVQCDVTVGVVRQRDIAATYPNTKRTVIRLREGGFCGSNLFTFNPGGRTLVRFWRQAEDLRKHPWRLFKQVLGYRVLFSYLFGLLTLQQALQAVSKKSGAKIHPIILDDPSAGIDIDKIEDLALAESILDKR